MIIDFHNHYYPPAYLDALRQGPSNVKVTFDDETSKEKSVFEHSEGLVDYLKRIVADQTLNIQILKEALGKD